MTHHRRSCQGCFNPETWNMKLNRVLPYTLPDGEVMEGSLLCDKCLLISLESYIEYMRFERRVSNDC